jgi:hypothetical protein
VRLLLSDDERQRYSAWYKDYGSVVANVGDSETMSDGQTHALTRSQHMLSASAASSIQNKNLLTSVQATYIDLQIALLTPMETVSKPMQVRLTRRNHCSDLRGQFSQSHLSPTSQSVSIPSYAAPSASSSAHIESSIHLFHAISVSLGSLAIMILSLFVIV